MAEKFGSSFAREMLDRGRRELGGFFYEGSPIAQPMYPSRSGPVREPSEPGKDKSMLQERLDQIGRDGPGPDGRDGPDRNGPEIDR
jgi:hypothetical protein